MEGGHIFKKISLNIAHLPTLMLIVGYFFFWAELYILKATNGVTSPLASIVFFLICISVFYINRNLILDIFFQIKTQLKEADRLFKFFIISGFLIILFLLGCAFYAAALPVHLVQEYDALNYHLTIPRQHLITNSFALIPWSSADLFLLPLDFALAPYWFVTELPNKIPQFVFLIGLILVSANLVRKFSQAGLLNVSLVIFAICGSHGIGIQMGTAMLDIVTTYLFLAAMDSFLKKDIPLGALESAFYFWAKPFSPIQIVLIFIGMAIAFIILKRCGFNHVTLFFEEKVDFPQYSISRDFMKRFVVTFILFSVIVAGPFLIKSLYYTGTPLFPFLPGLINVNDTIDKTSIYWQSILRASELHMHGRDFGGYGRSLKDFIKHFWVIAVPTEGTNNKYDYPLGLPYLLFLGPFFYLFWQNLKRKNFAIIPFFIVIFWCVWWMGSHQSRYLYLPIILMFITVIVSLKKSSPLLMGALVLSLMFTAISTVRAHKDDFLKSPMEVLSPKDKELVIMSKDYLRDKRKDYIQIDFFEAAYAQFPVQYTPEYQTSSWVLKF